MDFEYIQRPRLQSLSKKSVPVFDHPHREREKKIGMFLYVQLPTGLVENAGNALMFLEEWEIH